MAQFGARMNFLCNKQVLGILFILKINFCIYLPILYVLWIGRTFYRKLRGHGANSSKTQNATEWTAG